MPDVLSSILRDDAGQDLVEYVLLLALLALAVVAGLQFLGGAVEGGFNDAGSEMQAASGG